MHPQGHPRAGEVVEFPVAVPGNYFLEFRVAPHFVRFEVDVEEDGKYRMVVVARHFPKFSDPRAQLSPPVRKFLDVIATLMVRDMLEEGERSVPIQ